MTQQDIKTARQIMSDFAAETGLSDSARPPRRYLWTDAFAVCNFLALRRQTGDEKYLNLALKLVDQVHETLGKHHPDSEKKGWLSGLDDDEARRHPTRGGLRIGKKLNERQPGEPFDEEREWDRDGQYFHYLTKWMHALNAVSQETGNVIFHYWAKELAQTAFAAFSYTPATGGPKRMVWKMSIDLSRALVRSMGQHDPLDGLLTFMDLQATDKRFVGRHTPRSGIRPDLSLEISELQKMCAGQRWATTDSLGIGGLLSDAWKLSRLIYEFHVTESKRLESLLQDAAASLRHFQYENTLNYPAEHRLAFRELGLSIGLHALPKMQRLFRKAPQDFDHAERLEKLANSLKQFQPFQETIEEFWLDTAHQAVPTWRDHEDINRVMLATSLLPDGFLRA